MNLILCQQDIHRQKDNTVYLLSYDTSCKFENYKCCKVV